MEKPKISDFEQPLRSKIYDLLDVSQSEDETLRVIDQNDEEGLILIHF